MHYVSLINTVWSSPYEISCGMANARNTVHCLWAATQVIPGYSDTSKTCGPVRNQVIKTDIDRVAGNLNFGIHPCGTSPAHSWANRPWHPAFAKAHQRVFVGMGLKTVRRTSINDTRNNIYVIVFIYLIIFMGYPDKCGDAAAPRLSRIWRHRNRQIKC
jgi:hypothetical protein